MAKRERRERGKAGILDNISYAMSYGNQLSEDELYAIHIETLDIEVDGIEIASGAYGPHPLDANWGIFEPWVGIGFGLERIAMVKGGYQTIKRAGKSISYVNGIPLKL